MMYGNHPELTGSQNLGKTYTGGIMHLMDWHMLIAGLGGYTDAVNPNLAAPENQPQSDEGQHGLWHALITNGPSPRTELTGKAIWGTKYAIKYPKKLVWNTYSRKNTDDIQ